MVLTGQSVTVPASAVVDNDLGLVSHGIDLFFHHAWLLPKQGQSESFSEIWNYPWGSLAKEKAGALVCEDVNSDLRGWASFVLLLGSQRFHLKLQRSDTYIPGSWWFREIKCTQKHAHSRHQGMAPVDGINCKKESSLINPPPSPTLRGQSSLCRVLRINCNWEIHLLGGGGGRLSSSLALEVSGE